MGPLVSATVITRRAPEVSDEELLSVCQAAGEAGGIAWMRARGLYVRACDEWRERHRAALQAEAELIVRDMLREAAGTAWMAVLLRRGLGGGRD
jgi:hypothetical protein